MNCCDCHCTRCRNGEPLCYRNTPEAMAKREARDELARIPSQPESLFHRLFPDPITSDSLQEIFKDHYPADGIVGWEGTYRQQLMLQSLTIYARRLRRVTGQPKRSRTAIAQSLGMTRSAPIGFSGRPFYSLLPKAAR